MKSTYLTPRGFTLIELLVVIAIIGVLVSIVLPSFNNARDKAVVASVFVELDAIRTVFAQMYDDTKVYPNGANSYCRSTPPANNEVDLSSNNAGLLANGSGWSGWEGPYISEVIDPWGTPYYLDEDYDCLAATEGCEGLTDTTSVIVSCGPNRAISTGACAYDDDNIVIRLCD